MWLRMREIDERIDLFFLYKTNEIAITINWPLLINVANGEQTTLLADKTIKLRLNKTA
jgi:hypothetical protein